jgi:beta-glucosidase/6-phospho-beta-glucosidase/beta-galactosidase/ABC-type amino acid transport substrate-binding protein
MDWKRTLGLSPSLPSFPDEFMFGVATADHQCEAYDPKCEDIRDVWERQRGLTMRGCATDFEHCYPEDVELARKLGCTAFRFSVAWSRVERAPGQFDAGTIAYYRQLIAAIRAAGMEPILTLHHFTWPLHVKERGGMTCAQFPEMFEQYAAEVARRFGRDVRYWITFNEPSQLVFGYIKDWSKGDYVVPPGLPERATWEDQVNAISELMRNLFVSHARARQAIKKENPDALVSANPLVLGLPYWLQRIINWNASRDRVKTLGDLQKHGRRFAERNQRERGQVDVVLATLTRTPKREEQVTFSQVYYVAGQRLLVPAASPVATPQDLAGRTVVVVVTSTAEANLHSLVPGAKAHIVKDYKAALDALDAGKVDALLADDTILRGLMREHADRYRLVGDRLRDETYAAAVTQGHRELLDEIDLAVRAFKSSGEWAASCARNLDEPAPAMPPITVQALPPTSDTSPQAISSLPPLAPKGTALRRIEDRGYLIAGVKDDVRGFGYHDTRTDEWSGLEIDLARAIARHILGDESKVQFRPAVTRKRMGLLRSPLRFLDPYVKAYSLLTTIFGSDWWHLGMAGKLAEFLCPPSCARQQDFVGVDYYWGIRWLSIGRVRRLIDAIRSGYDSAPVWPSALHDLLRYLAGLFPDLPIMIIENGCVDEAEGIKRERYIRDHVREVQRAMRDKVNVVGYICWSITSNREWGLPFTKGSDFGLYHIDLDTDKNLVRQCTPAVHAYMDIIRSRGA